MPLFEYECKSCGHRFEVLVYGSKTPVCPRCEGKNLDRLLSTFATGAAGASNSGESCSYRTPSGCSVGGG